MELSGTIILGAIGTLVTGFYSWHKQKIANEQMLKELFTEFNQRYDDLSSYLNDIEKKFPTIDELNKAENAAVLKQHVIKFFTLCAEEFYWYHHKGRIDDNIWKSWNAGMNYWYNNVPTIKALWEDETETTGKASYYITDHNEFFKEKN